VRHSTGLPTLIVMCRPCRDVDRPGRKLAELDLGPDGPSQTHHTIGQWSGPDGDDKLHLGCPACGHAPRPIRRQRITQALAAITGKSTVYL